MSLETILRQAERRAARMLGIDVVYQRGTQRVELTATLGKTAFEVAGEYGVTNVEATDFKVMRDDLVLDEGRTEPERGDRIEFRRGAVIDVYEVMAPGRNPCWQWTGPLHTQFRVHTKVVEAG